MLNISKKMEGYLVSILNKMKVAQKLFFLIAVLLVSNVVIGGMGYYFINKTNADLDRMYNEKLVAVELLVENRNHARKIEGNTYALMLTSDPNENKTLMEDIAKRGQTFDANLTKVEAVLADPASKAKAANVRADLQKYRDVRKQVLELVGQNRNAEAYRLYDQKGKALAATFTGELNELSVLA